MTPQPKRKAVRRKRNARKKVTRKRLVLPEHCILLLCDAVSTDPNSKKKTLYGLFERLQPSEFPSHATFFLFVRLAGGQGEQEITCKMKTSRGKSVLPPTGPIPAMLAPDRPLDIIIQCVGVELSSPGNYKIIVSSNDTRIGELVVPVVQRDEE